jgi:site-specific recombinase XerD
MKLYDSMLDYMDYLDHEQGVTRDTIETYKSWLRHFHRWLEANGHPDAGLDVFNVTVLRRFLYTLSGRGYRPRTIRGVFHPLRGLGEHLIRNGIITENPARVIRMPKMDAAQRDEVSDQEITLLLEACDRQRTPKQIAFARAVMAALVYGGLRRQEMLDLKMGDVDLNEGSILVRQGKCRKSRKVFICKAGTDAVREWLAVRPKDCDHDWLFAYDRKRRLHERGLATLLDTLQCAAGLRERPPIRCHSLRHAAATRLLRNGANLKDISAFLGHSGLVITSAYLHTNEHQARSIAELTDLQATQRQSATESHKPLTRSDKQERPRLHRVAR